MLDDEAMIARKALLTKDESYIRASVAPRLSAEHRKCLREVIQLSQQAERRLVDQYFPSEQSFNDSWSPQDTLKASKEVARWHDNLGKICLMVYESMRMDDTIERLLDG
jgi:hypothetical protein